jgi:hypothetical protein
MPAHTTVDERYQSFNVEMVEVTGGSFWKPYASRTPGGEGAREDTPVGMDPGAYEYRPPKDLGDRRLRTLAAALAPAYMRVSGTWANAVYLPDEGEPTPASPPPGFNLVLPRDRWRGVVEFARAVDASIVTSFAVSDGTRDSDGVWTPRQAEGVLDLTHGLGADIAAAEFMNEPNLARVGSAPAGYDADGYTCDFAVFRALMRRRSPGTVVLGPGSVAESTLPDDPELYRSLGMIRSRALLAGPGADLAGFSSHHSGAGSARCGARGAPTTSAGDALGEEWLARTSASFAYFRKLRDEIVPGAPLWLTETAQAACGGDRWAATFLDSFRYVDQLGRLAHDGVDVVMHNTFAASDYGMLDEVTYEPRPNYWAALLWARLMGTTVLDSGVPLRAGLHVYAHALRGNRGGVAVVAINTSRDESAALELATGGDRYTLSADQLETTSVRLNGVELRLDGDALPALPPVLCVAGPTTVDPATITFFAFADARNPFA